MSILKNILGIKDIKKTMFYKEFSEENAQLNDLSDFIRSIKNNYGKVIKSSWDISKIRIKRRYYFCPKKSCTKLEKVY